jgi:hypothetical protein
MHMASETVNDTPAPSTNLIRLTHWDDNYAGDYDMDREVLRLFHRGAYKEYPIQKLIERYRKRGATPTPAVADGAG